MKKTTSNGCTEAEALAAAMKARELIERYQINLTEVELEQEGVIRGLAEKAEARRFNVQRELCWTIGDFCEVQVWIHNKRVVFFGLKSDVEFANWLVKALERFVWTQADAYALQSGESDYITRRSFCEAACSRINERLRSELALRKIKPGLLTESRSLVVAKQALVAREFERLNIHLRTASCSSRSLGWSESASAAGRAAGNKAGFGRPVNGGGAVKAIR
jgi:uncharacterized protein DUF2786